MTPEGQRPRVMFIDDEPFVLSALRRTLRTELDLTTFDDPLAALAQLERDVEEQVEPAVVVSDMRMPQLDGAQTLARAGRISPDSTRILLTGQADVEAAIRAINDASIFRFLTKPCPPEELRVAVRAGVEQHRLVTAERVLLERTLQGATAALTDVLSLAAPDLFTGAVRVKRIALSIARQAGLRLAWHEEMALVLTRLGLVSLPRHLVDKLDRNAPLSGEEQRMLARVPEVSARLLAGIPRLEPVRAAVLASTVRYDGHGAAPGTPRGDDLPLAARLLHLATDLDRLVSNGMPEADAVAVLAKDEGAYDPVLLAAAGRARGTGRRNLSVVALDDLKRGMTIAVDVTGGNGTLLIGRGSAVTAGVVERLRNHQANGNFDGRVVVEVE